MTKAAFPKEKLRFAERTLRVDISVLIKIASNEDAVRAETTLNEACDALGALGKVDPRYDVL